MILLAVLACFGLALLAPFVHQIVKPHSGWVLAILPASLFFYFMGFVPSVADGSAFVESHTWIAAWDVNLSFYLDGLSLVFALLITGIGALIIFYTGGYLAGHPHQGRFFGFMLAFMGSMLGLVLADNIISLFVFWELTSVTSFLLIGFDHSRAAARRAAIQALFVTAGGGLAMLAGFIMMGAVAGSFELSEILAGGSISASRLYVPIFILVMLGAFTKSAQVPFHFWLPNAMEAPTPVSAYLHSATMVKAGIYLIARLSPVLGGTDIWHTVLPVFGGATLIYGTILGLRQTDLKLMLAYTTVASLGLLTMLLGIGSDYAVQGAVLYLIAHSLFKGALFLVAGCVDHSTGTRETIRLGGLARSMPVTTLAALLAGLSMMGIPFFFGFLAKEVIYEATTHADSWRLVTATAVIGNGLMLAIAGVVSLRPFFGRKIETPRTPHEGSLYLWLGPLTLAVLGFAFGIFPAFPEELFVAPMVLAISGHELHGHLHAVPVIGIPFYLSLVTIGFGLIVFFAVGRVRAILNTAGARAWGPDQGSDQFLALLDRVSGTLVGLLQSGRLRLYVTITLVALAVTLGIPVFAYGLLPTSIAMPDAPFYVYGVLGLTVAGALALMFARSRLQAILSMGVTGFSVALLFLLMGAPDLAYTQFMVETLSVVIIALVLLRLPVDTYDSRHILPSLRDAAIAGSVGVFFTALLIAITATPLDMELSDYFTANSYLLAHGHNIVNVILVDFRALDTLGEISVVMVAGLAAMALIKIRRGKLVLPTNAANKAAGDGEGAE